MSRSETRNATPLPALRGGRLARFEEYVARFRFVFQRADQFLRFRAYVRGLLEPSERKNVEAIAAAASRVMMVESNLPQALQHFVSHSPWDARRLFAAVRHQTAAVRADGAAVWVVHDGTFAKRGRHSIGVRRQFARAVGKKMNCQIGVFVVQVGPAGSFPLAARLYLPTSWLRDHADSLAKLLPVEERSGGTKADIALRLLDELRAETETVPALVVEEGYRTATGFREGLAERGLALRDDRPEVVAEALQRFEWLRTALGLDHFEGRTWHGWHHHVSLVLVAYGFLCGEERAGAGSGAAGEEQAEAQTPCT